nr:hypothetical protein Ade03nite_36910 [Actinoplanes derwentensis]
MTANAVKPAVANMSLGGGADTVLDNAVSASIASGVSYSIAAGNGFLDLFALDACTQSPARGPAHRIGSSTPARSSSHAVTVAASSGRAIPYP